MTVPAPREPLATSVVGGSPLSRQGENNRSKTHCPYGHEYSDDNTYLNVNTNKRACRTCFRRRQLSRVLSKYKMTPEQYDDMLAAQGGGCAICDEPPPANGRFHVDHDHACCPGKQTCGDCVRGLLCRDCNLLLGLARDETSRLQSAILYLETAA